MTNQEIVVGAVAYDPKVVTIWDGMKEFFNSRGCPMDFVLFSNYEAQVEALLNRFIQIGWNTNLAYVKTDIRLAGRAKVLAMRDTDLEFTTVMLAQHGSTASSLADLGGKTVGLGSRDSAQAAIMPEYYLRKEGLVPEKDFRAVRFDSDMGKHGDTGLSEHEVVRALLSGQVDAGAVGETTWTMLQSAAGGETLRAIWTSPPYSHCNFTALPDLDDKIANRFVETLLKMDYNNPQDKVILDMEGLKRWIPGRTNGYRSVFEAVEATGYLHSESAAGVA